MGTLSKRGPRTQSALQKRFFALDARLLYYFKDGTSAEPLGKIPLGPPVAGFAVQDGAGFQFSLHTAHTDEAGNPRTYYLEAQSAQDKQKWMEELDAVIRNRYENRFCYWEKGLNLCAVLQRRPSRTAFRCLTSTSTEKRGRKWSEREGRGRALCV